MAKGGKVIITCAVTGAIHTPTMSPHLPITPDEVAKDAIAAAEGGVNPTSVLATPKTVVRPVARRLYGIPAAY